MPKARAQRPLKPRTRSLRKAAQTPAATASPVRKQGRSAPPTALQALDAVGPAGSVRGGFGDGAPDDQLLDVNVPGLGHNAANAMERHLALEHAVSNVWAVEDISVLRRMEDAESGKWVMWRR
ncbi:MAG: hypothetical protein JNL10_14505 [Verrucomicrobiales bacterium]|nr:hypothetical protein [Verrucomicrobiales bacterium]